MKRVGGYWGKIGLVNLSNRSIKYLEPEKRLYKEYIGGKGLGAKLLFDMTSPHVDPFSPDNIVAFVVGPVEGLAVPSAARAGAIFKSPLTGFFGESYCGGYIGTAIAKAGFDAIVVRGCSEEPVYLYIEDGFIEIRDASHLWGLNTSEAEKELWSDHGSDIMTALIGPAGERLVRFASIMHGIYMHKIKGLRGGAFGRTGGGAVLGSKKLKGIAVRGTLEVEPGDPKLFDELRKKIPFLAKKKLGGLTKYGTSGIMMLTNSLGAFPSRYYIDGESAVYDSINPEIYNSTIVTKTVTCFACPVRCGRHVEIEMNGRETPAAGPEYETLYSMGALTEIGSLDIIAKANELANLYGLDTITTGNVVAFAMYLAEKGILPENDIGFRFGEPEALLKAIEAIAYRKGIGDLLAEGVKGMAQKLGAQNLAVHVKGLEFPGYEPRALKGVALAYAVSVRGACHLRHVAYRPNLTGKHPFNPEVEVDRLSYKGHASYVAEQEDFYAVVDSFITCKFYSLPTIGPMLWEEITDLYRAVTGLNVNVAIIREAGERINNLIRLFNLREGLTRNDDTLPKRMFNEPLRSGASKGEYVDRKRFEEMLDEYYEVRGWNKYGIPRIDKLESLGLKEYALKIGLSVE